MPLPAMLVSLLVLAPRLTRFIEAPASQRVHAPHSIKLKTPDPEIVLHQAKAEADHPSAKRSAVVPLGVSLGTPWPIYLHFHALPTLPIHCLGHANGHMCEHGHCASWPACNWRARAFEDLRQSFSTKIESSAGGLRMRWVCASCVLCSTVNRVPSGASFAVDWVQAQRFSMSYLRGRYLDPHVSD